MPMLAIWPCLHHVRPIAVQAPSWKNIPMIASISLPPIDIQSSSHNIDPFPDNNTTPPTPPNAPTKSDQRGSCHPCSFLSKRRERTRLKTPAAQTLPNTKSLSSPPKHIKKSSRNIYPLVVGSCGCIGEDAAGKDRSGQTPTHPPILR